MKFLINRGININTFRREGETPRHYAVRMGSREKVELLLESGADGTTKDVRGLTPAEVAKEKGRMDLYEILSRQDPKGLWR
jgi:ankyrin repeat protein